MPWLARLAGWEDRMLRAYDAWDTRPLVLPRPTRLYSLAPIGVGTPMVESLTGYVVRLAEAHCVSADLLYWKEIRSLAGKGNIFTFRVTNGNGYSTHTINSLGAPAADFVRVLEMLTGRHDLRPEFEELRHTSASSRRKNKENQEELRLFCHET